MESGDTSRSVQTSGSSEKSQLSSEDLDHSSDEDDDRSTIKINQQLTQRSSGAVSSSRIYNSDDDRTTIKIIQPLKPRKSKEKDTRLFHEKSNDERTTIKTKRPTKKNEKRKEKSRKEYNSSDDMIVEDDDRTTIKIKWATQHNRDKRSQIVCSDDERTTIKIKGPPERKNLRRARKFPRKSLCSMKDIRDYLDRSTRSSGVCSVTNTSVPSGTCYSEPDEQKPEGWSKIPDSQKRPFKPTYSYIYYFQKHPEEIPIRE